MRNKKRRRVIRYGAVGAILGGVIAVGRYDEGKLYREQAPVVIWGLPIAAVLLAVWRNRRSA